MASELGHPVVQWLALVLLWSGGRFLTWVRPDQPVVPTHVRGISYTSFAVIVERALVAHISLGSHAQPYIANHVKWLRNLCRLWAFSIFVASVANWLVGVFGVYAVLRAVWGAFDVYNILYAIWAVVQKPQVIVEFGAIIDTCFIVLLAALTFVYWFKGAVYVLSFSLNNQLKDTRVGQFIDRH